MGEVLIYTGDTPKDLDPDSFLEVAKGKLKNVVIIGREKDGGFFVSSTHANPSEIVLDLQRAIQDIVDYTRQEE